MINAARILAARPRSKAAQDNMDVFKDQWETQVRLLTEAVDEITTIDDFLAVSGNTVTLLFFMRHAHSLPCSNSPNMHFVTL